MFDTLSPEMIPVVIFFARIFDVSLSTLRIVFVGRSMKLVAALLGFLEVLIWIIVVAQLMQHLNNWVNFVAYAAGFSVGTFVGITLENKLKVGTVMIRVITGVNCVGLIERLRRSGHMLTRVDAEGGVGPAQILFTVVKRKHWKEVVNIIKSFDPNVFYSVEDVKHSRGAHLNYTPDKTGSAFTRMLSFRKAV